ncbi:uncharacterized protein LOC130930134 [Corythoichthys intestinalis]|uniref:uncharacterized protein LOC130930134 n=1 Tax=Corythoichthys intestinalis TaxID=161448 RepID=UPI0025A51590|nr:uncharacterized protein LOC130930134 [Corythoichthys intestinalis]
MLPKDKRFVSCDGVESGPTRSTMICFPGNNDATLFIPWQHLPLTKWTASGHTAFTRKKSLHYADHARDAQSYGQKSTWYMTAKRRAWRALVAEDGHKWADWTSDICATSIRPQINLTRLEPGIQMQIRSGKWNCGDKPCLYFVLSPYEGWTDPKGDPFHLLIVCVSSLLEDPVEARPVSKNVETKPSGLIEKLTNKVTVDDRMVAVTGVTQQANNWLLLAEAAGGMVNSSCVVCMGPRPLLRVVPALLPPRCLLEVMTRTILSKACKKWDVVYPLTKAAKGKPLFSSEIAVANFSCIELSGSLSRVGNLNPSWCKTTVYQTSPLVPRSDVWWWCGGSRLYDTLRNSVGL